MDNLTDLVVNLIANSIWFIFGIIITLLSIRFKFIKLFLGKLGINIPIIRPQLDLSLEYDNIRRSTEVSIKNAGDRAAYNVYLFLSENYLAGERDEYTITSLGGQKIRAGILAKNEQLKFTGKNVNFETCNVTVNQEMWVEYTDEDNVHYRTIIIPPSPRGDDVKVLPPIRIQQRLPGLPNLHYKGNGNYEKIRIGKNGIPGLAYL